MANAPSVDDTRTFFAAPHGSGEADASSHFEHAAALRAPLSSGFDAWCQRKSEEWTRKIAQVGRRPPEPVLDPDSAQVHAPALDRAMRELAAILPPLPDDATPLRRQRHARLRDDLARIGQLSHRLPAMPPAQQGLAVRDAYARAQRSARQLAHNLEGSRWRRWKPEPQLATAYAGVAALLGALKDRHRSAAAGHIAQRDAEREARRLQDAGWREGHAGDALVTGSGASAAHLGVPLLGGGLKWQDWRFNDDDSKMYYVEQLCAFAEGGLGGELHGLKAKLAGKLASQFGTTVLMSLDQVALAKLVLNHHAHRAAFTADGPRARAALARLDAAAALAQRLLGKHYTGTPAAPCLADARLAKGVNSAKLELIARTIDAAGAGSGFTAWLESAYPSLPMLLRERLDEGKAPPKDLVQAAVGTSNVYRAKALGQHQSALSGEAAAGAGQAMEGEVETGAALAASVGPLHFFFALPRAAHELLDPAHTRDLRQTLAVHAALERELGHRPVMAPYRRIERLLAGRAAAAPPSPPAPDAAWPEGAAEAFGAPADVPRSFHGAVTAPGSAGLDAVAHACDTLAEQAHALVACAESLRARPSRHWSDALVQALDRQRREAFAQLAASLFEGDPPCTLEQALKRPEDFVARCHDALSLALARLQTQRWLLAHGLHARGEAPGPAAQAALARADEAHARARAVLDAGHLGLTKRHLTRDASVQAHATYQRHEATLKVSLGVQPPAPSAGLEGALGGEAPLDFSVHTMAGRLAFSGEVRWQVADHQINPARLGEFVQLTFKAEAGAPLLAEVVREAVLQALRQRFPGTRLQALQSSADRLAGQLQGLGLDVAAGATVVVKLRRAPGVADWDLQFVRGLATRTSGIDASATAATPAGLLKLGVQSGTTAQTCVFAAFGPDLGNLGMQMVTLERVLRGLDDTPGSLQRCFEAHPYAKTMYFGLGDTVPRVLQRFLDREDERAGSGGAPPARPLANEFYRFYDEAPFARVARTGPQLMRLKPGAGADATAREPVSVRAMFEARGVDWAREKRHIAALPTPEARLAYYAGEGRAVFDAFLAVLRELDGHTAAFIAHGAPAPHGFVMSVNAGG